MANSKKCSMPHPLGLKIPPSVKPWGALAHPWTKKREVPWRAVMSNVRVIPPQYKNVEPYGLVNHKNKAKVKSNV